jgi:hypothetical protein
MTPLDDAPDGGGPTMAPEDAGEPAAWASPAVLAEAGAWARACLEALGMTPAGPMVQVHGAPWSTVHRVATDQGTVFLKATAPSLRHEAAITDFLARRRPDVVPPPLAFDSDRGWLLMADAGTLLRDLVGQEHDVSRWLDVLPAYASLQQDVAGDAQALLALGTPDLRLAVLPRRFEALLDALQQEEDEAPATGRTGPDARARRVLLERARTAVPRVAAMGDELAAHGIAETIQHDDFHDGAVYLSEGGYRVLDWGDACVSHPFFSMSVTLEGVVAWGPDDIEGSVDLGPFRDVYLAPYAAGRDLDQLRAAMALAIRLGWACRAANGHVPGPEARATWTRLRMFLDGRPE